MQPSHDREISRQVQQLMRAPSVLLEQNLTPSELMGAISRAKLCLAMRLHTLIFAARVAVPVVGLVYDPKVSGYLEELDMPSAGHVTRLRAEDVISCAQAILSHYDGLCLRLRSRSEELERAARENDRLLLTLLDQG